MRPPLKMQEVGNAVQATEDIPGDVFGIIGGAAKKVEDVIGGVEGKERCVEGIIRSKYTF